MGKRFGEPAAVLAVVTAATWFALLDGASVALAQTAPLPTYGAPTSPLMQGYEAHVFRTFQLNVPVFVPLAELQNTLPPNFSAVANPSGSATAAITIAFIFHQRSERVGSVDGPADGLVVTAVVHNDLLQRNETVLLVNEQSDATSVANANTLFGEGTTRLAQVETEIEEQNGVLNLKFDATDDDLRLRVKVQATVSAVSMTRVGQDPLLTPFRAVNGHIAGNAFLGANRYDTGSAPVTPSNPGLEMPGSLRLPGGDISIVSLGSSISLNRWRDNYFKLLP